MRNFTRLAAVSTAALAAVSINSAAQAATAQGDASAEVLSTLTVTQQRQMSFGQVAVNGNGTIVLAPDGSSTCSAQLVCTGTRTSSEFRVTGTAGVGVVASVDEASISLTHTTIPANQFTLDNFAVDFPLGNTLAGPGQVDFNVGGTLNITAAAAAAGVYEGQFNVTVEYQ